MKKAYSYVRRSTDKQAHSLKDQRMVIVKYAAEQGYVIIQKFHDDAISGAESERRPGFIKMIRCLEKNRGEVQAVIVHDHSRFSNGVNIGLFLQVVSWLIR